MLVLMKGGSLAIVGVVIGLAGVLLALVVRMRWARPVGALLLAVAVLAEVAAVQARPSQQGSGKGSSNPILQTQPGTGGPLPSTGIPSPSGSFVIPPPLPHLLSQIHPGLLPITKLIVLNKEFARLTNLGTLDAHIGGWVLSNGSFTYTFPVGTIVPKGGSLIVRTGPGTNVEGTIHLNLTHYIWPKDVGVAILKNAQGKVVQACHYRRDVQHQDPSVSC